MLAEMGMALIDYQMHRISSATTKTTVPLPSWSPGAPEIEQSIAKALILAEHNQSLRYLRHRLTLMHATLVHWQGNNKHARVLLRGLLPPASPTLTVGFNGVNSTAATAWVGYEAHLTIVHQILTSTAATSNIPAAAPSTSKEEVPKQVDARRPLSHNDLAVTLSHLSAMTILAQASGDAAIIQVCAVIKLTILIQNERWDEAGQTLKEVERILGLNFTEKEGEVKTTQDTKTPADHTVTPLGMSAGAQVAWLQPNLHTPAFPAPINALAANPFATASTPQLQIPLQAQTQSGGPPIQFSAKQTNLIPPYLRHLRIQMLTLGVLYLTYKGESDESAKRLTLLHEMMDALSGVPGDEESNHGILEVSISFLLVNTTWLYSPSLPSSPDSTHLQPNKNPPNPVHAPSCALSSYICDLERSEARPRGPTPKEEDICAGRGATGPGTCRC